MNLTKLAKGRACTIRVPGDCSPPDTTVLCHVRLSDISGLGFKAPDWLGAFGCQRCHDIVDGRTVTVYDYEERRLMLLEGTARTLVILINEGVIYVPEVEHRRPKLQKIVPRRLVR